MRTVPNKIEKWINKQPEFEGLTPIEAMTLLMARHSTPYFVACAIGVYEHAVRKWIKERGWAFDGKRWIAPDLEGERAS